MISEFKKFKVQTISEYNEWNNRKISGTKLIAAGSDIDKAFKYMDQSIVTKTKNYTNKDWIVLDVIIKHSI